MEGETRATLGGGNVLVGRQRLDEQADFTGLNRDVNQAQVVTLDQQTGALDASVTLDNRMFTVEGWDEIAQQHKDLGKNWQWVAAGLEADVQRVSTDIAPDAVAEALKEADKYSLGLLPFDSADNGGLLSQAPVLFGSRDIAGGNRQLRTADDPHVMANPELYVSADRLAGYDGLSPEGKTALEGLVITREVVAITGENSTYHNHTNGMMNTPAEAMVNAIEQTGGTVLTQNYNPRHGFLADIVEIVTDKAGMATGKRLSKLGQDINPMTGAAGQTGEFMYDVMVARGAKEQEATFANHSQANILTLSGLRMLDAEDYTASWDAKDQVSAFQFVSYGSPVTNQTMHDALRDKNLSYVGSSANAGDFVAEALGGNTGIWLRDRDGDDFSNHTLGWRDRVFGIQDASLLLTGDKYPNSDHSNVLSPHSGYQCIVNCGAEKSHE